MPSHPDLASAIFTDEDVVTVLLLANDPRAFPTETVLVSTPAREITLNDLEALTLELRDECEWGLGYEESLTKSGGGIGASGATVLELVLGIIGVVPTVAMLLASVFHGGG